MYARQKRINRERKVAGNDWQSAVHDGPFVSEAQRIRRSEIIARRGEKVACDQSEPNPKKGGGEEKDHGIRKSRRIKEQREAAL